MSLAVMGDGVQQITRHRGHQRARQDERADQREHDGFGQRPEQISGDAAELEHRREHDVEHEQRHEGRDDDLLRAVQDRRLDLLALLEVIEDVLERDRPFVDQHADGKREAAQRHDVDGLAQHREHDHRKQDRQRDGDDDDDGRAPAAEEQQDHDADQRRGQHGLAQHPEDGGFDKDRLITHGMKAEPGRQALLDARQQRLDFPR